MDQVLPKEKVFLGGIHRTHTEGDLFFYFLRYGYVKKIDLIKDAETTNNKGVAFVTFELLDAAKRVVEDKFHDIKNVFVEAKFAGNREQMRLIAEYKKRSQYPLPTMLNSSRRLADDYLTHVKIDNLINEIVTNNYLNQIRNLDENERKLQRIQKRNGYGQMAAGYQRPDRQVKLVTHIGKGTFGKTADHMQGVQNSSVGMSNRTSLQAPSRPIWLHNSQDFPRNSSDNFRNDSGIWQSQNFSRNSSGNSGNNSGNWQITRNNSGNSGNNQVNAAPYSAAQNYSGIWQSHISPRSSSENRQSIENSSGNLNTYAGTWQPAAGLWLGSQNFN